MPEAGKEGGMSWFIFVWIARTRWAVAHRPLNLKPIAGVGPCAGGLAKGETAGTEERWRAPDREHHRYREM